MLKLLWRYYGWIGTAKTIYNRILKPVYLELKKDADELERQEQKKKNKKQTPSKDVINKKPKRSNKR